MWAPVGFIPLQDAARMVGRKTGGAIWRELTDEEASSVLPFILIYPAEAAGVLYADPDLDRVITKIAEQCETGEIVAAYRSVTGADDLDRGVWRAPCWRDYFARGTIDLDLPLLGDQNRPTGDGHTVSCTREIFLKRQNMDSLIKALRPAPRKAPRKPAARASVARINSALNDALDAYARVEPARRTESSFLLSVANLPGTRERKREMYQSRFGKRRRGRLDK